jgi:hypothetical protein
MGSEDLRSRVGSRITVTHMYGCVCTPRFGDLSKHTSTGVYLGQAFQNERSATGTRSNMASRSHTIAPGTRFVVHAGFERAAHFPVVVESCCGIHQHAADQLPA